MIPPNFTGLSQASLSGTGQCLWLYRAARQDLLFSILQLRNALPLLIRIRFHCPDSLFRFQKGTLFFIACYENMSRAGSARDMVDTGPSGPVPILLLKVLRFLRIEFLYPFCQNLAKPVRSLSVCNLTSCKTGETPEKRCPGTAGSLPDPILVRSVS